MVATRAAVDRCSLGHGTPPLLRRCFREDKGEEGGCQERRSTEPDDGHQGQGCCHGVLRNVVQAHPAFQVVERIEEQRVDTPGLWGVDVPAPHIQEQIMDKIQEVQVVEPIREHVVLKCHVVLSCPYLISQSRS